MLRSKTSHHDIIHIDKISASAEIANGWNYIENANSRQEGQSLLWATVFEVVWL